MAGKAGAAQVNRLAIDGAWRGACYVAPALSGVR